MGELKTILQLLPPNEDHRNLTLEMHKSSTGLDMFWEVLEDCTDKFHNTTLKFLPFSNCTNNLVLYTFSDKLFPATLSWLTAGG